MRNYALVQTAVWGHPRFANLTDNGKLLFLYLLTCQHSNGIGCFRVTDAYLADDLNWNSEAVGSALDELEQSGFCKRCRATQYVLIPKFLKWNPVHGPKVAKARAKEFESIPKSTAVYSDLCGVLLAHRIHWEDDFEAEVRKGIDRVSRKGIDRVVGNPISQVRNPEPSRSDPKDKGGATGKEPIRAELTGVA